MDGTSPLVPSLSRRQLFKHFTYGAGLMNLPVMASVGEAAEKDNADVERIAARIKASETIQRGRAAAVEVLQPSQRDLAHGLGAVLASVRHKPDGS